MSKKAEVFSLRFVLINTGNISRKVLSKVLRSFDKNFERLQWERLLFNPAYEGEDFMDMNYEENIVERNAGSCLSTSIRTNGAVAVFLPDVAQRIADLMDDDFYIVFTSVHEAMIHPKRMFCPEDLERILKETLKEATPDEDYLSDEIYYYDRGARKIMKWKKVVSKVTLPASCVERLPL